MKVTNALVSVIVVTNGSGGHLRKCLDSLKGQDYQAMETIVIDNSLDPNLAAEINRDFPFAKVYSNQRNLYYGVSQNLGIALSRGEFILCLNDDVVLDGAFIRLAIRGFFEGGGIGMVSGKILRQDGLILDSTGLFLGAGYSSVERGYARPDRGQFEKPGFIFGVGGAAAFYRRQMLEDIKDKWGYFDSRFLMFYEDLDVSWRANRRGWKAYYVPQAKAYHVRGGSLRRQDGLNKSIARKYIDDRMHAELIKNRYLAMFKNASLIMLLAHIVPVLLYDFCSWAYVLVFRPKVAGLLWESVRFLRLGLRQEA
jgi:GT2 family glycosyltransferase